MAARGETCSDLNPPLDVVPSEMISSCLFSSEICCAAKVRIEDCKSGVLEAKDGNDCHGNVTEFFTGCCESCKIGMVIGASENECDLQVSQFGVPFDDAYTYCCSEAKLEGVFYMPEGDRKLNTFISKIVNLLCNLIYITDNICGKFDRLCSQICVNTDDSYVCKCESGFRLLDDKITCELIESTTETQDNEVFGNHTEYGHLSKQASHYIIPFPILPPNEPMKIILYLPLPFPFVRVETVKRDTNDCLARISVRTLTSVKMGML